MAAFRDNGTSSKRPRNVNGQDYDDRHYKMKGESMKSEIAQIGYDNEGYDQPRDRGGPFQDVKRFAKDEPGRYAQPRGNGDYDRHPGFSRDDMRHNAYNHDSGDVRQRGHQQGQRQQYSRAQDRYSAQPYDEDEYGYGGVSPCNGMLQGSDSYPPNPSRGVVAGGQGSSIPGRYPYNPERRQSRSFYQGDEGSYQNMPFPGQLPIGDARRRAGYGDEYASMRQQGFGPSHGMVPTKDEFHGSARGRAFYPNEQAFNPQQGSTSRQGMSQKGCARGPGRGVQGSQLGLNPFGEPGCLMSEGNVSTGDRHNGQAAFSSQLI